jgi:hypothetical protein
MVSGGFHFLIRKDMVIFGHVGACCSSGLGR